MPIVEIISRACRDCYRCLCKCPTHAIALQEGHARIVAARCTGCGQCVSECSQHAIRLRDSAAEIANASQTESAGIRPPAALIARPQPTEAQLAEILDRIGMAKPEDELNCGACGYDRCRELAAAVFEGIAEVELCVPFLRRQAGRISLILQDSANALCW